MERNTMAGLSTIHEFLREARVPFTVVPQGSAFSLQDEACATGFAERHWAKVVVCVVDGEPVDAVIPASLAVRLDRLLELAGGREIRVAAEEERAVRAQAVFVDVSLASEPDVVFSDGSQVDAIAIRWADFARTVKPIVGSFAGPSRDRVPAYRLSYRE